MSPDWKVLMHFEDVESNRNLITVPIMDVDVLVRQSFGFLTENMSET